MIKVSMLIQSHLSDALIEMSVDPTLATAKIKFCKYLVHTYRDTKVEIDLEEEVEAYIIANQKWDTPE
jgi:hypothetical protein